MSTFVLSLKSSWRELKKVKSLAVIAMLLALSVVLGSLTINVSANLKIGFSFLAIALIGYLFGPVAAGLANGVKDILTYVVLPTGAYFPGFTFNNLVSGFIYGAFLYQKKVTLTRAILGKLLVNLIVNITLNSLWLVVLGGPAAIAALPLRIFKNLALLPIEVAMLFFFLKTVEKMRRQLKV